jgi:hypothetical protein
MSSSSREPLSREELEAEAGAVLPAKEVLSVPLLDLNADIDLALALAAPIDLAVAANANVVLPIDAAVSANVLSATSEAGAMAKQGVLLDQFISGEAVAESNQTAVIQQPDAGDTGGGAGATVQAGPAASASTEPAAPAGTTLSTEPVQPADATPPVADAAPVAAADVEAEDVVDPISGALDAGLLNVDVKVALDADLAAPIAGAVAANANIAAPIDAAVAANIGSIGSQATAVADQTAVITQRLEDVTAEATTNQDSEIDQ